MPSLLSLLTSVLAVATAPSLIAAQTPVEWPLFHTVGNVHWPWKNANVSQGVMDKLKCYNNGFPNGKPVLLVHGTFNSHRLWEENGVVEFLQDNNYDPCTIDLPASATTDMQKAGAYVAYNLHLLAYRAAGKSLTGMNNIPVAVIAHSQGNPDTQWGLKYWPTARHIARGGFIALAPDFKGAVPATLAQWFCSNNWNNCVPSLWQQRSDSKFITRLNSGSGGNAYVGTTAIWSTGDTVVPPGSSPNALGGSQSVVMRVQDFCPSRNTGHRSMSNDLIAMQIALNALENGGKANAVQVSSTLSSLSSKGTNLCTRVNPSFMSPIPAPPGMGFVPATNTESLLTIYKTITATAGAKKARRGDNVVIAVRTPEPQPGHRGPRARRYNL